MTAEGLPADLAAAVARAGGDPTAEPRPLQDALRSAIADRRGYLAWDVDHVGWGVQPLSPEWERANGDPAAEVDFGRDVLPGLRHVPLRLMSEATGLSEGYCSFVRRGLKAPHPRHREAFARLAEGQRKSPNA